MDTYSVFSNSSTRRDASRLNLDLNSVRRSSTGASPAAGARPEAKRTEARHIGIIGGGIAGLRCADILLQHGFRVTLLEGRHRLGGRLHQERLPNGRLVDMGPNWIHGTKENPILDLVRETGTVTCSTEVDEQGRELTGAIFDESGALLPVHEGVALSTAMWTIVEQAFVHSNEHCSDIDSAVSLHDFFLEKVSEHVPRDAPDHDVQCARIVKMADFWGAFVGSPITRQSLKYFWLEECIEGENLFCAGTYSKVLDKMAAPVVRGATIHYGQTVTRVESRTVGRTVGRLRGVCVTTATGNVYEFDEVVCTAPLGWLKQKQAATFVPPLPPRLVQAIDSIGYGCLEKVYVSFATAFWQHPIREVVREAVRDSTRDSARDSARESEAKGKDDRVVRGFCQWLAPGVYAQPTNMQGWPHEAVDLSAMPAETAHPTLLFYLFGDQSRHVTESLAAAVDKEARDRFVLDYFRPYYARLPHYDAASPACRPTGCLATSWLQDELAGHGSYSNFQVGLEAGDEDVRTMRQGVPERGLWLAGEHTAPFVALGTATGAYWSGESVGQRIAEAYGMEAEAEAEAEVKTIETDETTTTQTATVC